MSTATQDLILGPLNPEQREAVTTLEGPVLILAGAGSGKTRALTHRIAYLIENGVPPWQILAVTFTNKAAKEMEARIKNLLHLVEDADRQPWMEGAGKLPTMGTFHSICVRILRRDIERLGRDKGFTIYDQDDQERLMKMTMKELQIPEEELKARAVLSAIGRFKCEAIGPGEAEIHATTARTQMIVRAYKHYATAMKKHNALDFDDLITETVRLFNECPDVLQRYQNTWKFLHIDEYQDTNHAQYLLISQLAAKSHNLCVIGDPDQSIYAFRGADIRNILEFQKEYPGARQIKLEQNYRSMQPVLTAADAVISVNPNRPEKHMWTEHKEGPPVVVQEVADEREEGEMVIRRVQQLLQEGVPLKEQAILYRTHAQSRMFEEACLRGGVPYRILGGVRFYARREVKDVLGYLHVLTNPNDTVSLLRIINVPGRKIGETTLSKIQLFAKEQKLGLWDALKRADDIEALDGGVRNRIGEFTRLIERFTDTAKVDRVSELTPKLLEAVKMEQWLRDNTEEGEERWGNVEELLSVMHKYDHLDAHTSLTSFLEEVALVSEVDKLEEGKDALTLMTLHLCKGLEFEAVYVPGNEEGVFPSSQSSFDQAQLEEERRLLYVGMTRARRHLMLLFARSRMLWGERKVNNMSRFLEDLPAAVTERRSNDVLSAFAWAAGGAVQPSRRSGRAIEPFKQDEVEIEFNQDMGGSMDESRFAVGARVRHPTFGAGIIKARRGDIAEVVFDSGNRKNLALSIAPLSVID